MRTIFILISLIFSHLLFAGVETGNGGNVIICADQTGNIRSVELLDYFEVRLNGGTLKFNPALQTYTDKLSELFKRWESIAPARMALYQKWLIEFNEEAGIFSDISIPAIPDTGSVAIPKGCYLQPVAFQRSDEEIFPGTKRYVINKDIWDLMNETQKAGLVLHELIYREAIKIKHKTSLPTRFLNGYLSSAEPHGSTYTYVVSQMPLEWVEYGGSMVMYVGYMGCGWNNKECEFQRDLKITPDGKTLSGSIKQFLGNVKTDEILINFKDLYTGSFPRGFLTIDFQSDLNFEFNSGDARSSYDFAVNEIVVKNMFGFYFTDSSDVNEIRSASNKRQMRYYPGSLVPLYMDPEKSWIKNTDDTIISNIYTMEYLGSKFITVEGNRWQYTEGSYKKQ